MNFSQSRFSAKGNSFHRRFDFAAGVFHCSLKSTSHSDCRGSRDQRRAFASVIDGQPGFELVGRQPMGRRMQVARRPTAANRFCWTCARPVSTAPP